MPNRSTARIPRHVIPGRPVDWRLGGSSPDLDTLEKLVRELQERNSDIGDFNIPGGAVNGDVMLFAGGSWTFVNKASFLSIGEMTDVVITTPLTDDVLTWNGTSWVNAPITEFLELNDLSDVDVSLGVEGDFLILNALGEWTASNWTVRDFGIGAAATRGAFEITESEVSTFFTDNQVLGSALRGWRIDKTDAAEASPHGWTWLVEGVRLVDIGMDFDTAANGRSDFVLLGDHTFGATDDTFGDVLRYSLAADSTTPAVNSGKFEIASPAGSPKAKPDFITISGGDNVLPLGGIKLYYWSNDTTRHALHLMQRHGTSKRAGINFNDTWVLQLDPDADGGQEMAWSTGGVVHWTLLSPGQVAQFYRDAGTTNAPYAYRLGHTSSGTAAPGFGVGAQLYGQDNAGLEIEIGTIQAVESAVGAGAINCASYLSLGTRQAGVGMVEAMRLKGTGETTVRFDLRHEGANLGFFNTTPVARAAAYTVTNPTTDRVLDVTGDTLAQGLAVLGTLISDLKSYGLLQ